MKRHFYVRCIVSLITPAADTKLLSLLSSSLVPATFAALFKGKQCKTLFVHSHMQKHTLALLQRKKKKKICHDLLPVFENTDLS